MAERQRRHVLDGTSCQYLPNRVREFQRDRHSVSEDARVVVEFGQGKDVLEHDIDISIPFAYVDDERIWNFPAWVGLNARSPAPCP